MLSQCLCSESNKKNREVSEYPQYAKVFLTNKIFLLHAMYRHVRMIFIVKCVTVSRFFHCLCSALMEKHEFYSSVVP